MYIPFGMKLKIKKDDKDNVPIRIKMNTQVKL